MRRLSHLVRSPTAALVIAALAVGGCTTAGLATAVGAGELARTIYCNAITEDGRQAVRDELTGGVQVIPCEPPGAGVVR